MANDNICIGIDLGTTNSVIAWGKVDSKNVEPEIIDVRMYNEEGALVSTPLLPSCVHFPIGKHYPIVGEYGKGFTDPDNEKRTAKSFKINMGDKSWSKKIDGKSYNATDFSSMVLRHLKESAERTLFRNIPFPDNVAIAVPASFEPHMEEATLDAAREAGFKNPVLVQEPEAVLHDLEMRMSLGGVAHTDFDFKMPKLVLIFDLGGGTLDVSLYKVHFGEDQRDLQEKEIAVSRFTDIGGDDFDEELADHLLRQYRALSGFTDIGGDNFDEELANYLLQEYEVVDNSQQAGLKHRFRLEAEKAKIELSTQTETLKTYWEIDESDTDSIRAGTSKLSLIEYEEGVKKLLAHHLTWDSIDQYNLPEKSENIIDPIFDVLKKSEKKLGHIPKPEIVMLNGSMTNTYAIQKRLETFFGFPPVDVGNLALNVARGAVAHLAKKMMASNS